MYMYILPTLISANTEDIRRLQSMIYVHMCTSITPESNLREIPTENKLF